MKEIIKFSITVCAKTL